MKAINQVENRKKLWKTSRYGWLFQFSNEIFDEYLRT